MRSLSVERGKEFTGALYSALQQTREATPATTMYSLTARGRKSWCSPAFMMNNGANFLLTHPVGAGVPKLWKADVWNFPENVRNIKPIAPSPISSGLLAVGLALQPPSPTLWEMLQETRAIHSKRPWWGHWVESSTHRAAAEGTASSFTWP